MRHGAQTPRFLTVPPALSSAGQEAAELAASAGLHLDPWQRLVLDASLGERADGKWSASEVGVIVPRQNGKGSILEARELFGLFLGGERLILHSSHEFKTAAEGFLRIKSLIDNTDDLRKRVARVRTSHGEEGIELRDGARLRFVARSRGSGRGFSGDLVILDEAYALSDDAMAALLPTLSARPNPQVWYTSSAPMETSTVLRRLCLRGRRGESAGLAFFEWCADESVESHDRDAWAAANPGLGIRLSEEFTAKELDALGDEGFRRERLGIWSESATASVIPADVWSALADPESTALDPVAFAVEVNGARSVAAIGVAGAREDGRQHVEVIDHRPGTAWVVGRVTELAEKWRPCAVVVDEKGAAGSLVAPLRDAGVEVLVPTARDVAAAAGRFYDACQPGTGTLRHRGQAELDGAVAAAATRPLGDAWTWDRRKPSSDITSLVAVTLALWGFDENSGGGPSVW